ncbi:hypothetical protein KDRO_E00190 [Kluyveromyces lactis]|nr:hypothetical protein KDRO_E00190 [Kluyveromyces lactis]
MVDTDNSPALFCTDLFILPINSSTTLEDAASCGYSWGQKHKNKDWPESSLTLEPPFYETDKYVGKSGVLYSSCGSDYILEKSGNTTLQQSWQCGVFLGADVKKNSSSPKLRASVFLYLIMLVAYIM